MSVEATLEIPFPALAVTNLLPLPVLLWDTWACFNHTLLLGLVPCHCPKATTKGLGQAGGPSPPAALSQYRQEQKNTVWGV